MEVAGDKHTEQETKDQDKVNGCGSPDSQVKNEVNNDSTNSNDGQESKKSLNESSEGETLKEFQVVDQVTSDDGNSEYEDATAKDDGHDDIFGKEKGKKKEMDNDTFTKEDLNEEEAKNGHGDCETQSECGTEKGLTGNKNESSQNRKKSAQQPVDPNRSWGYQVGVFDDEKNPKKVLMLTEVKNYLKMYFRDKYPYSFYASIIDGRHPKFIRIHNGNRRWRMRYNIFVDNVFTEQKAGHVAHIGEIHLYLDIETNRNQQYRISLRDYQRYANKHTADAIDTEIYKKAEKTWSELSRDVQSMLQLKFPSRERFVNRNETYDHYFNNQRDMIERVKDFNMELQKWMAKARYQTSQEYLVPPPSPGGRSNRSNKRNRRNSSRNRGQVVTSQLDERPKRRGSFTQGLPNGNRRNPGTGIRHNSLNGRESQDKNFIRDSFTDDYALQFAVGNRTGGLDNQRQFQGSRFGVRGSGSAQRGRASANRGARFFSSSNRVHRNSQ